MPNSAINLSNSSLISALNNKADIELENSTRANAIESLANSAATTANAASRVADAAVDLIEIQLPLKINKNGDTFNGSVVVNGDLSVTGTINATVSGVTENANKAISDSEGNVIVDTYLTKDDASNTYQTKNNSIQGVTSKFGDYLGQSAIYGSSGEELRITAKNIDREGAGLYLYPNDLTTDHLGNTLTDVAGGWCLGTGIRPDSLNNTDLCGYTNKKLLWCNKTIGQLSSPSSKYIDLTLGVSGVRYTMPGNGYIVLEKRVGTNMTTASQYIHLVNITSGLYQERNGAVAGNNLSIYIPVAAGDIIELSYNASGVTEFFRFIYCISDAIITE